MTRLARLLLLAFCTALALAAACGGGDDNKSTPSPTLAPVRTSDTAGLEPVDVVRVTLDDINRADIDAAYPNFSAQARSQVSLQPARQQQLTQPLETDQGEQQRVPGWHHDH